MTDKEFLLVAKQKIYKHAVLGVNQLLGQSKTAQAAIGLMVNVPINVELRKIPDLPKATKKFKTLAKSVAAYIRHDSQEITMTFFYSKSSDLKRLSTAVTKHSYYFTYLYMRELIMLSRGYASHKFFKSISSLISKHSDKPITSHQAIMNIACYISISSFLETVYKAVDKTNEFNKIAKLQAYDPSIGNKPVQEIIPIVLAGISSIEALSDDCNTFQIEVGESSEVVHYTDFDLVNDEYDEIITDLGVTVEQTFKQACRDTATASIFKNEFEANTRIKTGWFKKLVKTFSRIVYYQTNDFVSSWGALNSTYRHKFKSPKHVYSENGIHLVLSIDQSGSMSTDELARVAGLINKRSKQINKLTVLIHDTEITKSFELDPSNLDVDSDKFKKALLTRYQAGGTSHYHVFKYLDSITDKSKLTYISYSDNYSDIQESYKKFPSLRNAQIVFLCTIDNPVNIPGTTDITFE